MSRLCVERSSNAVEPLSALVSAYNVVRKNFEVDFDVRILRRLVDKSGKMEKRRDTRKQFYSS